jgi:uncharacterized delta-60 repeat protein
MDIRFTLQAQYAGAEYTAGPFNLYGYTATTSVSAFTLASGITKQQLLTGYTVTTGLNIVSGYIQSTGTCSTTPPEAYTLQFSGGPVIIGTFSNYGANSDVGIVKLSNTLALDTTFNVGSGFGFGANTSTTEGGPFTIVKSSNGKIVVAGSFTSYDGVTSYGIVRLNPDGSRDYTFSALGTTFINRTIMSVDVQPNGKIIVGGSSFVSVLITGAGAGMLFRLNLDGSLDSSFNVSQSLLTGTVRVVKVLPQDNNNILVASNGIALFKVNSTGTAVTFPVTNINPPTTSDGLGSIQCLELDSSGRIMIGGAWSSIFNTAVPNPIRISASGVLDTNWYPRCTGGGGTATSMVESNASTNEVVIVGNFTTVGLSPISKPGIVKVNTTGGILSFTSAATFDTSIDPTNPWFPGSRVSVLTNGNVLWIGKMSSVNNNNSLKNIVVLDPSTGTPVTQTTGLSNLAIYRDSVSF